MLMSYVNLEYFFTFTRLINLQPNYGIFRF